MRIVSTFCRRAGRSRRVCVASWAAPTLLAVGAAPPPGERIELPVRRVVLSDGTVRYGVPVRIVGREVEAGLDIGSTGLRVMARALPSDPVDGPFTRYHYSVGTQLEGKVVRAPVAFGSTSGTVTIQRVDRLSCIAGAPKCPVSRNSNPATFGIQGDGAPNEGFAAILGVDLRKEVVPNPLEALGVRRWIIELPRPGDTTAGRIILNPNDADVAGFANYKLMSDDKSLSGCITGPQPLGNICGWAILDTGAPGLLVFDTAPRRPLDTPIPVTISLGDAKRRSKTDLVTGRRDEASRLILGRVVGAAQPRLYFGVAPYLRWSVLYDADAHTIGLRPR